MNTSINERIKMIADTYCNGNVSELARLVGVNQPVLRDVIGTKQVKPGFDALNRIVENSTLKINADWLLTGRGEMLIDSEKKQAHRPEAKHSASNEYIFKRFEELIRENESLKNEIQDLKNAQSANAGTRTYIIDKKIGMVAESGEEK